ncbi:MAG: hypothetical protein RAO75_06585 [Candidatus Chlorobium antarcticum]|jgi:hypothetical protein|nr:hypothetical protein [Candidatus Chlorobium antarcticum]
MIIYEIECSSCYFRLGVFTENGSMYVTDDKGKRIVCRHPLEDKEVYRVLGQDASQELVRQRTGMRHSWLCMDCLKDSLLDIDKDGRSCQHCGSANGALFSELQGRTCPSCGKGKLSIHETGMVT